MPASEMGLMERVSTWTGAGAAAGGFVGMMRAAYGKQPVGAPAMGYVRELAVKESLSLASIAAVFATTDTLLTQTRGHSVMNHAAAGCAAGALLGAREGSPAKAAFGCAIFGMVQFAGGLGESRLDGDGH